MTSLRIHLTICFWAADGAGVVAFAPDDVAHMQHAIAISKEADRMEGGPRKLEQAFFTAALADRSASGHVDVSAPLVAPAGEGE